MFDPCVLECQIVKITSDLYVTHEECSTLRKMMRRENYIAKLQCMKKIIMKENVNIQNSGHRKIVVTSIDLRANREITKKAQKMFS